MELKKIKDLMAAMNRGGIKKLSLKEGDFELHLEKSDEISSAPGHYIVEHLDPNPMKHDIEHHRAIASPTRHPEPQKNQKHAPHSSVDEKTDTSSYVTSPMVGTFYASTSPDTPPYLKVGDTVEKNTVVCIVEAMKVMNEVKAGLSGVVAEILVENAHPVEFGTKLFRINPK